VSTSNNNTVSDAYAFFLAIVFLFFGIFAGFLWGDGNGERNMKMHYQCRDWVMSDGLVVHKLVASDEWEDFVSAAPENLKESALVELLREINRERGYVAWEGEEYELVVGDIMLVPKSFEQR
jgi:hypothetical protein